MKNPFRKQNVYVSERGALVKITEFRNGWLLLALAGLASAAVVFGFWLISGGWEL